MKAGEVGKVALYTLNLQLYTPNPKLCTPNPEI
jgi:hypothetical protein